MPRHPGKRTEPRAFKITVVGDGTVGKTCLLISYTKNQFPTEYVPTVFDTHRTTISVDGTEHPITLWDTAGQEQYDRLRYLTYPKTDCFIVCYSVDKPTSFDNIMEKWHPELKNYCPNAAIILVGTKSDLKGTNPIIVSSKQAKKMKSRIKAYKHLECSAQTRENLEDVFVEAVRAVLAKSRRSILPCKIT
ncbi:Ras-like GTP-binding protein RhoL [Orchesella cincta]|uniref:Ras-like GTP-binding protein RhoL n=1 Tax=Orchesella cincta TaxID=48709 RepID=A0A1D2N3A8_ORCCI|nr:Ras-like GTP-binding protein RhoL [Orchesella cincta]